MATTEYKALSEVKTAARVPPASGCRLLLASGLSFAYFSFISSFVARGCYTFLPPGSFLDIGVSPTLLASPDGPGASFNP